MKEIKDLQISLGLRFNPPDCLCPHNMRLKIQTNLRSNIKDSLYYDIRDSIWFTIELTFQNLTFSRLSSVYDRTI